MRKEKIMPSAVLGVICIAVAALLAVVNIFTGPVIDKMNNDKANAALLEVYPGGTGFEKIDLSEYAGKLPPSITAAYTEASGGYVIQSTVTGYKPGLVIMCGIDSTGKIVGADYILSNETLSAEVGLGDRFVGKGEDEMSPDIVAGSTAKLTTGAYYQAILDAFGAVTVFEGGEVDNRTPEEILQDNCNAALGTEKKTFTKWIALASLDGIDAVYVSDAGRVYVIGDAFVGIKADGTVATADATEENKAKAIAADEIVKAITLADVEKPADAKKQIVSIKKASNGAYLFELSADGYQVKSEWGNKTPIKIMLSISAEGKIIDCVTVSQSESKGFGDSCATEEYTGQYKGKGDADITVSSRYPTDYGQDLIPSDTTDVGAIASSTYTTVGYQTAVKAAFEAFNLLTSTEGGN
ncbi:MAG: FMN-binding protein [Clostridia bacterium]|nr:FMN-binding protein [Clostridia bacterium]